MAFPEVLEERRASAASVAFPVVLEERRASGAWAAYRAVQAGLHQVAWAAWVAGQEALGVSHRSSFIPQHRSGATSSWTHGEHITILQG